MRTTRLSPSTCPSCGKPNDSATSVGGDHKPESGDFTVCLECGHIMAYDDELKLRELTKDEQIEVAGDQRILAVQAGRKKLRIGKTH